jgi:nitroreductase
VRPFDLDEIDRLLTTTKAVRRRLDLARPVDRSLILECIRLASFAPNASNAQEWRWVVVDDPEVRRRAGE